jgi:HK97 family phage major capsid protein
MTLREMRASAKKKIDEARGIIHGKPTLTAEEQTKFDNLMGEYSELSEKISRAAEVESSENELRRLGPIHAADFGAGSLGVASRVSSHGDCWRTADGAEVRCLGRGDRLAAGRSGDLLGRVVHAVLTGEHDEETRASLIGKGATGDYLLSPNLIGEVVDLVGDASQLRNAGMRTVLVPGRAMEGRVVRQSGSDPEVNYVPEGALIPEGDVTFDVVSYRMRKAAALVKMSHEATRAENGISAVQNAIVRAVASELDRVALLGTGAAEEPLGISNTTGINTITSVGDINYDDILNAVKKCRESNFEPTAAIWSPATDYELSVLKAVSDGQYLIPPAAYQAIPKFITNKTTDALAFVGDFSQAFWVQSQGEGMRIEIGQGEDTFKRDMIWLRVIVPVDVVVVRPQAICKLSGLS